MSDRTLDERVDDALTDLKDWLEANPGGDPSYDSTIHEIADGAVPIYYSDILQMAADNNFLALEEPEIGPAFDGTATPINIIAANIYEHIYHALYEYWDEYSENTGFCDECNKPYEVANIEDHCAEEGLCWDHCTDKESHSEP